jgi:hypothetical protein
MVLAVLRRKFDVVVAVTEAVVVIDTSSNPTIERKRKDGTIILMTIEIEVELFVDESNMIG